MLPGVRAVLSFFEGYQKQNGSLKPLPWWRYFDWVPSWPNGEAPQEEDGSSAPFDLLLMMATVGPPIWKPSWGLRRWRRLPAPRAATPADRAATLLGSGRHMYADTPRKEKFSQHTNTLAVLGELIFERPRTI